MSSAAGNKNYGIYLTDISGSAVSNISGGWNYVGVIDNQQLSFSTATVTPVSGAVGLYITNFNDIAGSGIVQISRPPFTVAYPPHGCISIDDNTYDADTITGSFLSSQTVQQSPSSIQSNGTYQVRTNTDFEQSMVINTSSISSDYGGDGVTLTGWGFTVGSMTPYISGGSVTVVNTSTRTVKVEVAKVLLPPTLLTNGAGLSIYFDMIGTSPTGKKKVVLSFQISLTLNQDPNN